MATESRTTNFFETETISPMSETSRSVQVKSTSGLNAPVYLVIDPDIPEKREIVRATVVSDGLLEEIDRGLDGIAYSHDAGAKIRTVFTKQLQEDIFTDIKSIEEWVVKHVNPQQPGGDQDPHPMYLTEDEGNSLYLPLLGGLMGGNISMGDTYAVRDMTAPTADGDATRKSYVDAEIGSKISDHAAITDAHHARYTDAEALAANQGEWLPLAGVADAAKRWETPRVLTVVLEGDVSGSANTALDGTANKVITITSAVLDDSHTHDTRYYKKAEVDNLLDGYLPLTGGSLSGALTVQGDAQLAFASGQTQVRNLDSTVSLLIGTTAIASNKDGEISSGAGIFPWSTVYTNALADKDHEFTIDSLFSVVNDLVAHANANGASIDTLA